MDEQKATEAGPVAPKRRGRPPGIKRRATDRELIEQLAARIDSLQKSQADQVELAKSILAPAVEEARPGTILAAGKDQFGSPVLFKKTWALKDFDVYPKVTFTPSYSVPVTVHRRTWNLEAGQEITVPSVVKDVYDSRMRIQHPNLGAMYPAPNPTQVYEQNEAARRQSGVRVFSGLHFLNTGFVVETPEAEAEK